MKIGKPKTPKLEQRARFLYDYMKSIYPASITKEEVCDLCGVKHERQAREILSKVGQTHPLHSTSDSKGFRLCLSDSDLRYVLHQHLELASRIRNLQKRLEPLIRFEEEHNYFRDKKGE